MFTRTNFPEKGCNFSFLTDNKKKHKKLAKNEKRSFKMIKIIVKIKERTGRRDDGAITLYGNDTRHKYSLYVSEETFPSFVLISLSNFDMTYLFIFRNSFVFF